jgi:tetratricopeptide (TPR) repeat protein
VTDSKQWVPRRTLNDPKTAGYLLAIAVTCTLATAGVYAASSDVVALNNDGVKALNAGDYTTAIQKFETAIKIDPTYQLARENLGITYNNYGLSLQGSPMQAIVQFHKAMFLDPTNATTSANLDGIVGMLRKSPGSFKDRVDLGDQARLSGDFVGAIVEYRAALKLNNDADTHVKLGDVYRVRSMNTEAVQEYQAAAQVNDSADVEVKLGQAYQSQDDLPDAIQHYGMALKYKADDPDVVAALVAGWEKALQANPSAPENHIGLGQALQYRGDFDQAAAEYKTALMYDPNNQIAKKLLSGLADAKRTAAITKHVDAGVDLQSRKLYDQAIEEYKYALKADPRNAAILVNIGSAYQQKSDFDDAITNYQQALSIDPTNSAAQQGLKASQDGRQTQMLTQTASSASEAFKLGRYDEAIAKYQQVLQSNKNDPETHFNLAASYQAKKDLDDAIAEYRQAIALDPNNADYKSDLDQCLSDKAQPLLDQAVQAQQNKDYLSAVDLYTQALDLVPKNATVWYNLAATYYAREDYVKARDAYQKALTLDPQKQADDLYFIAIIDENFNNGPQALQEYKRYVSQTPMGQYAQQANSRIQSLTANMNATIKIKPAAQIAREKEADNDYQTATQLQQQQRWDEAIAAYQKAIDLQPQEPSYAYGLGTLFEQKGDMDLAIKWYQTAISLDPKNQDYPKALESANDRKAEPIVDQAVKLQTSGDVASAIDLYNQATALVPKNAHLWTDLASAYQNTDQYAKARDCYQRALSLDPKGEVANWYFTALLDENAGQGALAFKEYQQYITLAPNGQFATAAQSRISALGMNPNNVAHLKTQRELRASKDAEDAYNQGVAAQQANNLDGAISSYEKAAQLAPQEPAYLYAIGTAYQAKGDIGSAIPYYQQAGNLDPKNSQYQQALSTAYDLKSGPIMDSAIKKQAAGDLQGAITDYRNALSITPRNARGYTNLASAYQAADDFANARLNFQKAVDLDPRGEADNWYFIGALDENAGQGARALQDYQKYVSATPGGSYSSQARDRLRALSANANAVNRMTTAADQRKSTDADSAYQAAIKLQQANDFNGAIEQYKKAIALIPSEPSYWYSLGTAYQGNNNIDQAIDAYGRASTLNPNEKSYKDLINQLKLAKAGPLLDSAVKKQTTKRADGSYDLSGAIADYEAALQIVDDPTARLNLGTAYQANNQPQQAMAQYNRVLAMDPKQYDALYYLGTVYDDMKQTAQALANYRKYLTLAPSGANAADARERVKALASGK